MLQKQYAIIFISTTWLLEQKSLSTRDTEDEMAFGPEEFVDKTFKT